MRKEEDVLADLLAAYKKRGIKPKKIEPALYQVAGVAFAVILWSGIALAALSLIAFWVFLAARITM